MAELSTNSKVTLALLVFLLIVHFSGFHLPDASQTLHNVLNAIN